MKIEEVIELVLKSGSLGTTAKELSKVTKTPVGKLSVLLEDGRHFPLQRDNALPSLMKTIDERNGYRVFIHIDKMSDYCLHRAAMRRAEGVVTEGETLEEVVNREVEERALATD